MGKIKSSRQLRFLFATVYRKEKKGRIKKGDIDAAML
jgi:hypothetical protein